MRAVITGVTLVSDPAGSCKTTLVIRVPPHPAGELFVLISREHYEMGSAQE